MLTSSRRKALFGLSVAFVLAACASKGDPTGEGVSDHTVGEPVTLNNLHVWAEVSDADFGKGMSSPGGGATSIAPRNNPATVRIDQWLDRYHSLVGDVLREHGQTLTAPKPSAALVKEYGPNAWVSSAIACPSGWTLRPVGGFGGGSEPNLLLTSDYAYGLDVSSQCVSPQNWTDKGAFASFWNSQSSACRLSLDTTTDTLGVSGGGCSIYGRTAPLATYATSSTIAVTLDAITWGDELRVADTLAHELGHYYRAHSNPTVVKEIGFFYRDDPNGPDRPVPAAESATYEQIVNQLRGLATPIRIKPKTRFNKRLAGALFNLKSLCPNATLSDTTMRQLMSGQVTSQNTSAYLAFENVMATCLAGVSMASVGNQLDTVLRQSRIYLQVSQTAATVNDAFVDLSSQLDVVDRNEAALVAKMSTGTFGWYTEEQEADEIGLELAARAGIDPNTVIQNNVRTYEQLDALYKNAGVDRGDEVTMETCKKWLAAGFTEKAADGTKQPIRVPIGSLSDNHHDGCYRIYNMWRESKRHQYVVAPPLPALSPSWATIQDKAAALGGTKPPTTDGSKGGGGTGNPEPNGGSNGDDDDENTPDPEDSAPPPRRPRPPPTTNGADSAEASDAGVTTMTKTTSACAMSAGTSSSQTGVFGAGLAIAIGLILRRRPRASTSSKRRA